MDSEVIRASKDYGILIFSVGKMAMKNLLILSFILLESLTLINALETEFVSHDGAAKKLKTTAGGKAYTVNFIF